MCIIFICSMIEKKCRGENIFLINILDNAVMQVI